MIAYLKRNFQILHLIFFKPKTFGKTYANISRLEILKLSVEQLPFVFLISVLITTFIGGVFEFLGLGFNWLNALIELGKGVAFGVAFGVAAGVAFGVAVGVARGVAVGVAFGVTGGVAGGVAFFGTAFFGMAFFGVAFGVAAGVAVGVAFGVAVGVAVGVVFGVAVGVAFGVAVGVAVGVAYFRLFYLINYLIHYFKIIRQPRWVSFNKLPVFYDEVILFPLPRLYRLLVALIKADRTTGMKAIDFIIQERPYQFSQARRALFEIGINDMCFIKEFGQIANAPPPDVFSVLQNLPEKRMPKNFKSGDIALRQIAALVAQYNTFTTIYSRQRQLEIIEQKVKEFQRTSAFLGGYVAIGFAKVAKALGELVEKEETAIQCQITTEPIPNPFVVGNPLRHEDKEVFQGRVDVARMLESEIMRDKSMSPLLLYGKRRIGKTSTLNNLQKLLGPSIIPVILDCQNVGLAESDAGFLYYFLNKIQEKVPKDWVTPGDAILSNRQEFDKHPFEMSNKFFDHLSKRMEAKNFRLLLCFDEYETLNRYYDEKRITANLLYQLRHYIQHQPRLAFLFAGAHRMTERRTIR